MEKSNAHQSGRSNILSVFPPMTSIGFDFDGRKQKKMNRIILFSQNRFKASLAILDIKYLFEYVKDT